MSHVGVFEVVAACALFRNVDLFQSGLYAVRVRVVTSATKTSAAAVRAMKAGPEVDKLKSEGSVDAFTYTSGSFEIQYSAQQVVLNEGAVFRLELPMESVLASIDDVLLQVQLAHTSLKYSDGGDDPVYALKDVSTVTYRFATDLNTTSVEHLPVVFDEDHFAVVDMVVAKSLVGVRADRSPLPRSVSGTDKAGVVRSRSINKQALVTRRRWSKKGAQASKQYLQMDPKTKIQGIMGALQSSLHTLVEHITRVRKCAVDGEWEDAPVWEDVDVAPPPSPFNADGTLKEGLSYRNEDEAIMAVVGTYTQRIKEAWGQWVRVVEANGHRLMALESMRWQANLLSWWRARVTVVHCSGDERLNWSAPAVLRSRAQTNHSSDSRRSSHARHTSIARTDPPSRSTPPFGMLEITSPIKKGAHYELMTYPNIEQQICEVDGDDNDEAFKGLASSGAPSDYMRKDKYNTCPLASSRAKHLVVCVHGFGGNSFDVRQMGNFLSLVCPRVLLMHSAANESATALPIETQGERLALEVNAFIGRQPYSFYRISFIAHSLGGVLVRAALTHSAMAKWLPSLHTLVTLSSPHLGYLYNHNRATNFGVWTLCKVSKSLRSLRQLRLADVSNPKDSYLYKLSEKKTFGHFSNVVLVSSSEDGFVPYHSARLEVFPRAKADAPAHPEYVNMANNVFANLGDTRVVRLDVNFDFRGPARERAFGRTAHILFLDNARFCHMFTHLYADFFA